eukprot:gnl/MRDRNA2_/MRDRNA2_151945_c0_seq1.p1 gnl/MRDRNA2_/MRDRNA2_151945_c0~~gnl/MRDRNA2_/MRDRNA2_151945_c0_seq1.p1  ORF type:complete len:389 (+),score=37.87 gnl/MRDRNA2_/MRDRNA2_151945_c0_seq1:28-1194(+)
MRALAPVRHVLDSRSDISGVTCIESRAIKYSYDITLRSLTLSSSAMQWQVNNYLPVYTGQVLLSRAPNSAGENACADLVLIGRSTSGITQVSHFEDILNCLAVWRLRPNGHAELLHLFEGPIIENAVSNMHSVAVSPDGRFLSSGSVNGIARLWSIEDGALISDTNSESHKDAVQGCVVFSEDSMRFAVSKKSGRISVVPVDPKLPVLNLMGSSCTPMAFSRGSDTWLAFMQGDHGQCLCVHDYCADKRIQELNLAGEACSFVSSLCFSSHNSLVCIARTCFSFLDRRIVLQCWNINNGCLLMEEALRFPSELPSVLGLSWHPRALVVTLSHGDVVKQGNFVVCAHVEAGAMGIYDAIPWLIGCRSPIPSSIWNQRVLPFLMPCCIYV